MGLDAAAGPVQVRGRVVMLVDNDVRTDSRVQKTAHSAADAGWDVIVLGRSGTDQPETFQLGLVQVRLIPTPGTLARRRHEFRRPWLRRPFAYPPTGIATQRGQVVRAWQADLRVRETLMTLGAESGQAGLRRSLSHAALRGQYVASEFLRHWVNFRAWQLSLARSKRKLRSPWDRAYMAFWQLVQGDRAWRRLEPGLWDFELAYGPVVDELQPDLIHAHDFRMVGVGARATIRARGQGRAVKLVWDAHEFLPGVKPWHDNPRWLPAHCAYIREYVPFADAIITVSEQLADMLVEYHKLAERPAVIMNAPELTPAAATGEEPVPDLREICGIGPEVPLLVYSGTAPQQRGLDTMIDGLAQLERAHVALVVGKPHSPYVAHLRQLQARAEQLGVADRVHIVPYVPFWQVPAFLSAADVGVIPIHHWPNHEIALIQKFFEYSHARLPIVVSDVKTMAETVQSTGQGEVFRAEDVADYVRAVRAVLADPSRYRAAYDKPGLLESWTWETQVSILDAVYSRLLPDRPAPAATTPDRPREFARQ
jgi:glycosyltransferase involved in cell wall biosynthesis